MELLPPLSPTYVSVRVTSPEALNTMALPFPFFFFFFFFFFFAFHSCKSVEADAQDNTANGNTYCMLG